MLMNPMTDQIREQISALIDGELRQDEIGLLVRRMERDAELRRAFGSYVLLGEALRSPGALTASPGFAARVAAQIDGEAALPATIAPRARTRAGWGRPALATAVAAGAAVAAMLLVRPDDGGPTLAKLDPVVTPAALELPVSDGASPTPAQSQRLAGYLVAHSQFASPIGRRILWTSVLAQDPGIQRVVYETAEAP
jgi:sigma-E factor negative regulatory protein RseA